MDQPESTPPPGPPSIYNCPGCGTEVELTITEAAQQLDCPRCGESFVVPGADGSTSLPHETPAHLTPDREDELNKSRIRLIAQRRVSAYRMRSLFCVAIGGCVVAAIQLVINAFKRIHTEGITHRATFYLIGAGLLMTLAAYFLQRALAMHFEATNFTHEEPDRPPDFSPLSDGSNQAEKFNNIR